MGTWTTKIRGPAVGLGIAVAVAASLPIHADTSPAPDRKASKQENIGVLTGLAVGAAAGGPIGAVVGAAAGGLLGDRYHKQQVARQTLAADLSQSEAERKQLIQHVAELDTSLHDSQVAKQRLSDALQSAHELATDVCFRTDDATLDEQTSARLQKIAKLAGAIPDAKVKVDGYADPRGADDYNMELSLKRAQAVADVLTAAGLAPDRVIVDAHGAHESTSAQGDLDGYALERRVTIQLEGASGEKLAHNP